MPRAKKVDTITPAIEALTKAVEQINVRLDVLEKPKQIPVVETPPEPPKETPTPAFQEAVLPTNAMPIPPEYREVVNTLLNKKFGVEIEGVSDMPAFRLVIVVPSEYSTATPDQLASIGGRDIRPFVVDYAMGINGVREWVERVWSSFSPDVQARISTDRNS